MNRILALAFLIAAVAPPATPVDNQAPAPAIEASKLPESGRELSSFFEKTERTEVTPEGMTVFRSEHNSVIVARVGTDGKMVTSCVVTEAAARAFLKVRDAVSETSRVK